MRRPSPFERFGMHFPAASAKRTLLRVTRAWWIPRYSRCKHWVATRPAIPDILKREVGGRRVPRQPGQVRKEAALTSVSRVARPASHLALKRYSAYRAPRLGARCTYLRVKVRSWSKIERRASRSLPARAR